MPQVDTIRIRDLSDGIVQKIADVLAPQKAVKFAENVRFDKILGSAIVRDGTSLVGAQIADTYSILGLHQFILSSGTKHLLAVVNGASVAAMNRLESGTWTGKTATLAKDSKHRFLTYLDVVAVLDGTNKYASEDGDDWVSNSDVPTAPSGTESGDGGSVDAGDHYYKVSFVNPAGETLVGAVSGSVTSDGSHAVDLTSVDLGVTDECTSRKIYRTKTDVASSGTYYLVGTLADNSTEVYQDTKADSSLGAASLTISTAGTNLNIGDMPAGDFIIEWNDRVYVAGVTSNEDRLYYSTTPSNYVINWSGEGSGYIDIEPFEGQGNITALAKVPGYILIFKDRSLKRWNGRSTYPDDLCKLGTPSQESVVLGKRTVFYFSSGYKESIGFYETNGEDAVKISRPIQEIVDAISSGSYDDVAGFSDGEIVIWSIGDITYDGTAYSNACVLYHIDSKTWSLLTFPSEFKVFHSYVSGTDLKIVGGNDDGEVIEVFDDDETTDDITGTLNAAISYTIQYYPMDFGVRSLIKEITKIIPHFDNLTSVVCAYKIDKHGDYTTFGTTSSEYESEITGRFAGHAFEFKFTGSTSIGGEFIGFDIVNPNVAMSQKI